MATTGRRWAPRLPQGSNRDEWSEFASSGELLSRRPGRNAVETPTSGQREGSPTTEVRADNGSEEALKAPSQRLGLRRGDDGCDRREDDARRRDIAIFLRRLRGELSGSGGEIARPLSWLHPKTVRPRKLARNVDGHDLGSPTPAQRVLSRKPGTGQDSAVSARRSPKGGQVEHTTRVEASSTPGPVSVTARESPGAVHQHWDRRFPSRYLDPRCGSGRRIMTPPCRRPSGRNPNLAEARRVAADVV